jgi:uncharacterized iron-regulated membrane protein
MNNQMTTQLQAQRKSLFWRIHFWAALIASPFAIVASLTGIIYIFTPQIEGFLYGHLDNVTPLSSKQLPLDASVNAAMQVAPQGMVLRSVVPAFDQTDSVRVTFAPKGPDGKVSGASAGGHAGHSDHSSNNKSGSEVAKKFSSPKTISQNYTVYVDPYTAKVLGSHAEQDRFNVWSKRLHSSLLQGDGWRWMIELSASWLIVMLLTGLWLWWQSRQTQGLALRSLKGYKQRLTWVSWHSWVGAVLSAMSLIILVTGLTWSKYAGEQIRELRDLTGQAPPVMPKNLKSQSNVESVALSWQQAHELALSSAPKITMQMQPPKSNDGIWRINHFDRSQPTLRFDLALDRFSGKVLYRSGWEQQTAFGKATAVGIPFHRGEFGWWNQLLLLVFGLGILASISSGWVTAYLRFRSGVGWVPRLVPGAFASMPIPMGLVLVLMCILFPLLGITAMLILVGEAFYHRRGEKINGGSISF